MKKLITFLLFCISALYSAQLYSQSIGIKGGLNYSSMFEESDLATFSEKYKLLPGFNAGIMVEIPYSSELLAEAGLFLNTKGFKLNEGDENAGVNVIFKTLYLDVPIKAKYITDVGSFQFFASGGVYAGFGLSGTSEMEVIVNGNSTSTTKDILWGDDAAKDDLLKLDYGVVGSAGLMYKSIIFEVSYSHGLANISPYTEDEYTINNKFFSISMGYKFEL